MAAAKADKLNPLDPGPQAYFVQDMTAPEKGGNTHDFRDPSDGSISPFEFKAGVSREVPLYVARRCEEINNLTPANRDKPFHISIGAPSGTPYDSADVSTLSLAEVVARMRVKAPAEAEILMTKLEDVITQAVDRATATSAANATALEAEVKELAERLAAVGGVSGARSGSLDLAPNQVVAVLDELVQPALLKRAEAYEDGKPFNGGTRKEVLIDFLTKKSAAASTTAAAIDERKAGSNPDRTVSSGTGDTADDTSLV